MVNASRMAERRAVFLDRDGVLIVPEMRGGRSYAPRRLGDFQIYPEAKDALTRLRDAGYLLVVVTNQPDVGKGLISQSTLDQMHERIRKELCVDRIEVCPHTQADECSCRKPKPGMLLNAARECQIDLTKSFMVGDRASDVAAGIAAGCKTIFIDLNYISELKPKSPHHTVRSIAEAAGVILAANESTGGLSCRASKI
jgi:D-glycero-D-manno-heptose 1,7-bisphosphate phosphatase